ncbi:hypothetical protein ACFWV1_26075 [Streptomyces sp. NPDC058700]|uniref:hypothetical protein n=1 Tax=Streptomyces sp. NPDC058700 TaxID=3346607 RepID=UPI003650CC64
MTAQGDEVVAFLERAITQAEKTADHWHDRECEIQTVGLTNLATLLMASEVPGAVCDCSGPTAVLRRCTADRKLVYEVRRTAQNATDRPWDPMYGPYAAAMLAAAKVVAEGYGWSESER